MFKPAFSTKNISIVFSTDKNYFPYFLVALESIIQKSSIGYNYDILLLHTELSENEEKIIIDQIKNYHNFSVRLIDVSDFSSKHHLNNLITINHLRVSAYYRLLIGEILLNYDKIVYLDCDLIAMENVAKLYEIDIGQNYLGVVRDVGITSEYIYNEDFCNYLKNLGMKNIKNYFNSGVLIMNLKAIRQANLSELFFKVAILNTRYFHDQNVLNIVCEEKIYFLDEGWNVQCQRKYNLKNLFILHYCSQQKPWNTKNIIYSMYWWNYAKNTFFYKKILAKYKEYTKNKKKIRYKILYKLTFGKMRRKYKRKYKGEI